MCDECCAVLRVGHNKLKSFQIQNKIFILEPAAPDPLLPSPPTDTALNPRNTLSRCNSPTLNTEVIDDDDNTYFDQLSSTMQDVENSVGVQDGDNFAGMQDGDNSAGVQDVLEPRSQPAARKPKRTMEKVPWDESRSGLNPNGCYFGDDEEHDL